MSTEPLLKRIGGSSITLTHCLEYKQVLGSWTGQGDKTEQALFPLKETETPCEINNKITRRTPE